MNRHSYPAQKPSGVEWLGEIPAHWEVKRLKHVTRCLDGKRVPLNSEQRGEKQGDIPYWGANGVLDHLDEFLFDEPLVLLGEDGAPFFDRLKDVAFYVNEKVWVNNHAHVLRPVGIEPVFLAHTLNMVEYRSFIDGTTRDKLTQDDMDQITIQTPPVDEQHTITAFLDRETSRIDALLKKKQKQIELLQEKRTALISHTVTKGLNPNAKMKDSGVEWLGEIPEHWKTKRLKFVADISTGDKDTENNVEDGKYPFFVRSQTIERIDSYSFDGEAVLTAGDGVGVAKVFHYINGKFDFHQRVYKFSDFQSINGKFFFYYTRELFREEVLKLSAKSTVDSLRLPMIQDFVCCVPTLAEQAEIVEYMDRETGRIENAVSRIAKSITLLREYRTSLISAAVTGKIDVRKEAA